MLTMSAKVVRNHLALDELFQESVLAFLENPKTQACVDSGSAMFWFWGIVKNRRNESFKNLYRNIPLNISHENIDPVEQAPFEETLTEAQTRVLHELLAKLNWYDRHIAYLILEKGQTMSSLARETTIPRSAIKREVYRIKKFLKEEMEKTLPPE